MEFNISSAVISPCSNLPMRRIWGSRRSLCRSRRPWGEVRVLFSCAQGGRPCGVLVLIFVSLLCLMSHWQEQVNPSCAKNDQLLPRLVLERAALLSICSVTPGFLSTSWQNNWNSDFIPEQSKIEPVLRRGEKQNIWEQWLNLCHLISIQFPAENKKVGAWNLLGSFLFWEFPEPLGLQNSTGGFKSQKCWGNLCLNGMGRPVCSQHRCGRE